MSNQPGSRLTQDPRKAPKLTREKLKELSPKEYEDRQEKMRVLRMQQLEVEITEQVIKAVREGVSLEQGPVAKVAIENLVVQIYGADDKIALEPKLREKLLQLGGESSVAMVLRDRATVAAELHHFRLPPDADVELPGRNREERRQARAGLSLYPYRDIAKALQLRRPGEYYIVVHSAAGATASHWEYREEYMQAALDEEYAKRAADKAAAEEGAEPPPAA